MSEGLKALEIMTTGLVDREEWKKCYEIVEKELKALDIIFSKQVDINLIYECSSYDSYCDRIAAMCPKFAFECDKDEWFDSFMLTEDEWKLLWRLL